MQLKKITISWHFYFGEPFIKDLEISLFLMDKKEKDANLQHKIFAGKSSSFLSIKNRDTTLFGFLGTLTPRQ